MVTSLVEGDWNLGPGEVEALADRADAEFARGHGIDHVIFADAELISVKDLGEHGSDHPAQLFTFRLHGGEEFRLLGWNVYVGQHPDRVAGELAKMIDHCQPHAAALQEAYRCRKVLGQVAGYRRIQGTLPWGEDRDCALLIRRDLQILRSGLLRMTKQWIGPKHGRQKGARRYPRARVRTKSGHVVRLLSIHLPTGGLHGRRNGAAVRESADRIVTWIKNR